MMLLALALAAADAPSFDCARASTNVEKMICADAELAAADRAVARLYVGVPRSARSDPLSLWKSQNDWLKERDKCEDKACLLVSYEERLWDLFLASTIPTREYGGSDNNGSLSILDVGNGWLAFHVQGIWIGSNPGQVNDAQASGIFRLVNGVAERAPSADDYQCGWRIEHLPHDRWKVTELPYMEDRIGCGGLNATVTGIYSR